MFGEKPREFNSFAIAETPFFSSDPPEKPLPTTAWWRRAAKERLAEQKAARKAERELRATEREREKAERKHHREGQKRLKQEYNLPFNPFPRVPKQQPEPKSIDQTPLPTTDVEIWNGDINSLIG
jgi:hypothetical protein